MKIFKEKRIITFRPAITGVINLFSPTATLPIYPEVTCPLQNIESLRIQLF